MIIKVHEHKLEKVETPVNELELNITKIQFEFDEGLDGVKKAYFTLDNGNTYMKYIENDEVDIPGEVLEHKGTIEIGVSVEEVEDEEVLKRYNPSPVYIGTLEGSLKDYENAEPITPTDKEQIETWLNNINIDGVKVGKITTITIVYKDGTSKELELEDGMGLVYNWDGTKLGIKREDESSYSYVDLKGDKGEPGAIKMVIVNDLPLVGSGDTIYLVPVDDPEQSNRYDEYIYVNNTWEKLGGIQVEVDLTDYVKNTDYATNVNAGVIIGNNALNLYSNGKVYCAERTYAQYQNDNNYYFIGKGTLENVITGKGLVSNTNYANGTTAGVVKVDANYNGVNVGSSGFIFPSPINYATYQTKDDYYFIGKGTLENVLNARIGDIDSVLDAINGEVI